MDGLGNYEIDFTEDALETLVQISSGDARSALNALELAVLTTKPNLQGSIYIDQAVIKDCSQKKTVTYDKRVTATMM